MHGSATRFWFMKSSEAGVRHRAKSPNYLWVATLVLLTAAVLRLVAIHDVPPGLSQDEVLNADIVTFIRQGRHALFFREGFGHEPLYHYWSVPFQILLGDNVLSIRLPAVFLGLLLIAAVMSWARRDFDAIVAVCTGLGLAISWWPIIFSRVGIRPILEPLLLVLAAFHWSRRPWIAGVFIGLSIYSYTAARVFFLLPAALLLFLLVYPRLRLSRGGDRPTGFADARGALFVLTAVVVVVLPLVWTLQADPSLQERVQQLEGPLLALSEGNIKPIWESTIATLGVFAFVGDPRWTYTLPGRPLFDPATAVLFGIGISLALARLRQPRYAFVLIWLFVGLLPSAITPQAPSTIRLIGSLPVVYLLPGVTIAWSWRSISTESRAGGGGRWFTRGYWILLVLILVANLARTVGDGFMRWPSELETRFKYQTVLLDMGRHWQANDAGALTVTTGFFEPITADSFRRNLGFDPEARWVQTGADVAGAIVIPNARDDAAKRLLYLPELAPLEAELMEVAGISAQPLFRSDRKPSFAVYSLPTSLKPPAISTSFTFEDIITLQGYELPQPRQDETLKLFTTWRVEAQLPWDLAIFVHLLDEEGQIVAQHDGLDAAAITLRPGDVILQRHLLPLPVDRSSGAHTLQAGLYTRGDERRLTRAGEPHDRILLVEQMFLTEGE